nr:PREDICTED: uncharacterized protein LOC105664001 isoform X2 [Megachile rotundata]
MFYSFSSVDAKTLLSKCADMVDDENSRRFVMVINTEEKIKEGNVRNRDQKFLSSRRIYLDFLLRSRRRCDLHSSLMQGGRTISRCSLKPNTTSSEDQNRINDYTSRNQKTV